MKRIPLMQATFALPVLLALSSLIGLTLALLGDGLLDVGSWIFLGIPVAVIVWLYIRAARQP
ncbi:hypothetical protein [Ponticaulis profundi]|uniref:CTP synthetase n=1 Tax=Ponticaulis profundi TaxID=2665222 RepID=A0ABW1S719_9PROT|tara:strand:+ start:187 stop:372 length:186 start_codon:yes stop_codon:yes gene_type:complete